MSRVLVYLARFTAIVFGFACAAAAASLFFHTVVLIGLGLPPEHVGELRSPTLFVSVPVVAAFIAYYAFLPAFAFFLCAELFGWRSWLVHALAGGAAAGASLYAQAGMVQESFATGRDFDLLIIASGMVGGLAYWFVAGRRSGLWLQGLTGSSPSGS